MTDTLLIIGNGFDLAMGSKTRYSDFVKFVEEVNRFSELLTGAFTEYRHFEKSLQKVYELLGHKMLDGYIKEIDDLKKLNDLFQHNAFVDYILENKERFGQSWADLEHHISDIAEAVEELTEDPTRYEPVRNFFDSIEYNQNISYRYVRAKGHYRYRSNGSAFDYILKVIYEKFQNSSLSISLLMKAVNQYFIRELEELTLMLQFYLVYLEQEEAYLTRQYTALDAVRFIEESAYLITFNYTNTARYLLHIPLVRIHHIHGQINAKNLQENNMVFGIEDKDSLVNPVTIDYQKYYQRITKGTGNKYKKFFGEFKEKLNIIIFGHSLDPLDKEIFLDVFNLADAHQQTTGKDYRVMVTFYDNADKQSIVRNLSIILGKERIIELTGEEKLHFIKSDDVRQMSELLLR